MLKIETIKILKEKSLWFVFVSFKQDQTSGFF